MGCTGAARIMQDRDNYLADLVRREDRDRFLTALLVPADRRSDVLALYAFNAELARIRSRVSENIIGRMKLQWWRDVIEGVYSGRGGPKGNPLTEALADTIARRHLSRAHFDTIITTREREMDTDDQGFVFTNAIELETFAEGTASRLIELALEVLGTKADVAARHVGIGVALTGILRAVVFQAGESKLIPKDVVANTGLAMSAETHFTKARVEIVPRAAVPALLSATIASRYLQTMKRANYQLGDPRILTMRASVLGLVWNAWRGKF